MTEQDSSQDSSQDPSQGPPQGPPQPQPPGLADFLESQARVLEAEAASGGPRAAGLRQTAEMLRATAAGLRRGGAP